MSRPVITFLTDFGPDAAAAICRAVMLSISPDAAVIDISHSVRKYAIRDAAFLLWCSVPWLPVGVHVAVVDPGVGTARRPIGIRAGRGDVLVGPDNGLLYPAADRLGGIREVRLLANRELWLSDISSTFHGRDLFAPTAAHLTVSTPFEDIGPPVPPDSLVRLAFPVATVAEGVVRTSILYIDSFGNARLSCRPDDLRRAVGDLEPGSVLAVILDDRTGRVRRLAIRWVATFGDVEPGEPLLYEDSFGLVALAVHQGNAADHLGLLLDEAVQIGPRVSAAAGVDGG